MSYKIAWQESPARVSYESVSQERRTRVPLQEFPARVSVIQECPTRVTNKSVPQECPTRVFRKSVPQESECHIGCPTRVHKSVPQRFPKRMCPTRVSHKNVSCQSVNCLGVCFRYVFAFGFVGSILFFYTNVRYCDTKLAQYAG